MIVAAAQNGIIGRKRKLPWDIPEDTSWLQANLRDGVVVYGRTCYEEIGRAIPGVHHTVVVSRGRGPDQAHYPDAEVAVGFPGARLLSHMTSCLSPSSVFMFLDPLSCVFALYSGLSASSRGGRTRTPGLGLWRHRYLPRSVPVRVALVFYAGNDCLELLLRAANAY